MESSYRKATAAVILSAILVVVIVGSMMILDEVSSDFKNFLNSLTGHHLVTKSIFISVLFPLFSVTFYFAFKSAKAREKLLTDNIWGWSLALVAVIVIFYLLILSNYILNYII